MKREFSLLKRERIGWLFVAPWIAGFCLLTLLPLLVSLYMAFHDWNMFSPPVFVGLDNFKTLLDASSIEGASFYAALSNTLIYTVLTAAINLVVGLSVAWAVARASVLNTIMRTIIYLPCMVIGIAFSMMMGPIFGSSEFALVNQILHLLDLPPQEWLFTHGQGVWVMVLMSFWGIGGAMIVFVAGIKNIDSAVYDAASIDGAGNFYVFLRIMLPMVSPAVFTMWLSAVISLWGDYMTPMIYLQSHPTLSAGLYNLKTLSAFTEGGTTMYFAALIISVIPVLILYVFTQNKIFSINLEGGIKA